MNHKNLIGYTIDTNQFTIKIENLSDANLAMSRLLKIYGDSIVNFIYLTSDRRFSTFAKTGMTLSEFLSIKR